MSIIIGKLAWLGTSYAQGYDTYIDYRNQGFYCESKSNKIQAQYINILNKNENAIKNNLPFEDKATLQKLESKLLQDQASWSFAEDGILIGLSLLGIMLLFLNRKKNNKQNETGIKFYIWIFIFLALMSNKLLMNSINSLVRFCFGIEYKSNDWMIWIHSKTVINPWIIDSILGIFVLTTISYITFGIIPKKQRILFLSAGLIAGFLGFWTWSYIGSILLPQN